MTGPADPLQIAWQRRAVAVLADLLDQAARDSLPVLAWTVGHSGAHLLGRAVSYPVSGRRDAIGAWGAALGIELRERVDSSGVTRVLGVAEQRDTAHGFCTITLAADVYADAAEEDG